MKKCALVITLLLGFVVSGYCQKVVDTGLFVFDRKIDNEFVKPYTFSTKLFSFFYSIDTAVFAKKNLVYGVGSDAKKNLLYYFDMNQNKAIYGMNKDTDERAVKSVGKVAVTTSGRIYCVDYVDKKIFYWNIEGDKFRPAGQVGEQYTNVTDLCVDKADNLFILDSGVSRVYKYSTAQDAFLPIGGGDGSFLSYKPFLGIGIGRAVGITVSENSLYLVFELGVIMKLAMDGTLINTYRIMPSNVGLFPRTVRTASQCWLTGIAMDPFGNLLALDANAGCVHVFTADLAYVSSWRDADKSRPIGVDASDICVVSGYGNVLISHPWGFYSYKIKPRLTGIRLDADYVYPDFIGGSYTGIGIDLAAVGSGTLSVTATNKATGAVDTLAYTSLAMNQTYSLTWTGKDPGGNVLPPGAYTLAFSIDGEISKELPVEVRSSPSCAFTGTDGQILDAQTHSLAYTASSNKEVAYDIVVSEKGASDSFVLRAGLLGDKAAEIGILDEHLGDYWRDGIFRVGFRYQPRELAGRGSEGKTLWKEYKVNKTALSLGDVANSSAGLNPANPSMSTIHSSFTHYQQGRGRYGSRGGS